MDTDKTQGQLLEELAGLRRRVAEFEECQQKASEELKQRIEERTAALIKVNAELTREIEDRSRAEERFAKAFQCNPSPMAISTSENRFLEVNQALLDTLQYGRDDIIGATASDLGLFVCPERQMAAVSIIAKEGHLRDYALDVRTRTGQVRHGLFSGEIIQLHDQQVMLTVMHDVTELRLAEKAVRQSEKRLQLAQHIAKIGTFEWDIQKEVNSWTPELEAMYGLSPGSFPGTQAAWENLIHSDDRAEAVRLVEQTVETGEPVEGEWRVIWPDGSVRWLAGRWQAFMDESGKPLRMIGVNIDITDRKRTEECLRQHYDELRAIYDEIVDGIIVVDIETSRLVRANAAYCRMLGYSKEEALSLTPVHVHPPEVLPRVREHIEAAKQGTVARIEGLPFLHKDGGIIYADVVSSLIHYNESPSWISFFHDVTDRKLADEALQRQHRTLKHLLQSSDHERQTIAYEIHDELAQQLTGAIMQFEVSNHIKVTKPQQAVDAHHAGMTLLRQAHREARRLIAGVRPPILDEAGVVDAVSHLVNELRREKGPKIEFRNIVEFDRLVPILENAAYRITQEALANACKHSGSEKVNVTLLQQENHLRIEIRDWGVGFETKTNLKNHYGLEGIRQRAKLLGGKCRIRSKVGKGTRVIVELPVVLRD
ncbi:MAG: PAS domain-containing sensor histidine kinase [Pirellulaceae bacterium]